MNEHVYRCVKEQAYNAYIYVCVCVRVCVKCMRLQKTSAKRARTVTQNEEEEPLEHTCVSKHAQKMTTSMLQILIDNEYFDVRNIDRK
jgi:hypothetical protein